MNLLDLHSASPGRCSCLCFLQQNSTDTDTETTFDIWTAPWKNRIRSTTTKLRKSLVKPVTRQKTCNYIELFGSSTRDRHAQRIWCYSLNIHRYNVSCMTISGGRTTRYNCRFSAASLALRVIFVCRKRPLIYASCTTISVWRTEQHGIIGFGELAAVD